MQGAQCRDQTTTTVHCLYRSVCPTVTTSVWFEGYLAYLVCI